MSQAIAVCHGEFGRAALYRLDKTIIKHAHREGHLIFYVDGANAQVSNGDIICKLDINQAVAVSPWEPHGFDTSDGAETICLVLYIKPIWFLENSQSAEFALNFGDRVLNVSDDILELVRRLTALLLENEEQNTFDGMLFSLTRACFDQSWLNDKSGQRSESCNRFSDFRVRRSLRLIQNRMGEDFEIERLARSVGLSRPHFFKLFKQYMGVTPNVYINTLRSERAIDDLLNTDKTVTDIAFDLGFSSQASFTRFFSSNVGIAPSEYRRVAHVTSGAFPMM